MRRLLGSTRGLFIACVAVSSLLAGLVTAFVWLPLAGHLLPPGHFLAPWVPMVLSILLAIPNIIFGFYGMNVSGLPLDQFFWFPLALTGVIILLAAIILKRKDLL